MGFTVPQRILLIGLLLYGTGAVAQTVNPTTLMNIVNNFERQFGRLGQYAVAFRVTREQCQNPNYDGRELITQRMINDLWNNEVHESNNLDLIAAKADTNIQAHSEYRLKNLLNNILNVPNRCVVYFTVNSPCMNKCLSNRPDVNIRQNLQDLQNYNGMKAFAFKKFWRVDEREEVIDRLKEIAPTLPYYQCRRNTARCNLL